MAQIWRTFNRVAAPSLKPMSWIGIIRPSEIILCSLKRSHSTMGRMSLPDEVSLTQFTSKGPILLDSVHV